MRKKKMPISVFEINVGENDAFGCHCDGVVKDYHFNAEVRSL